jgi:hypothetical protein
MEENRILVIQSDNFAPNSYILESGVKCEKPKDLIKYLCQPHSQHYEIRSICWLDIEDPEVSAALTRLCEEKQENGLAFDYLINFDIVWSESNDF